MPGASSKLVLVLALALTPGCLTGNAVEDENPDCAWDGNFGETGDVFEGPEVELGDMAGGKSFEAWDEGESLTTVTGPQGLEMLMPYVRVDGGAEAPADGEERCLSVYIRMTHASDDPDAAEVEGEAANGYTFTASGGDWLAGPLWAAFDSALVGGEYDLQLTVRDLDADSRSMLRVSVNVDPGL